jgi:hypothetical protein
VSGLGTKRGPIAAGAIFGVLAICVAWLFENDSSPLVDYYAQNVALSIFWSTVNTLPRFVSHIAEILLTGNVHVRNEAIYALMLFLQWFLLGYVGLWLVQLGVRSPSKGSQEV